MPPAAVALAAEGVEKIDGVLLDLGVSSYQLDTAERGFSYNADAYLDMRMSKEGPSAADLVNSLSVQEITDILRNYGEEKYAYQIARKIESLYRNDAARQVEAAQRNVLADYREL